MRQIEIKLNNKSGLHARPASVFIKEVSKYSSNIKIIKDESNYDGKSIIDILTMGASYGETLKIQVEGEDEDMTISAIESMYEEGFGE